MPRRSDGFVLDENRLDTNLITVPKQEYFREVERRTASDKQSHSRDNLGFTGAFGAAVCLLLLISWDREAWGNVVSAAAGGSHTCALLSELTVHCWGSNYHGALGDGTTKGAYASVRVTSLPPATAIAAGGGHSCALLAD